MLGSAEALVKPKSNKNSPDPREAPGLVSKIGTNGYLAVETRLRGMYDPGEHRGEAPSGDGFLEEVMLEVR